MYRLHSLLAILFLVGSSGGEDKKPTYTPVDLQPYANQKREESLGSGVEGNNLATLPGGEQSFEGVKFKVGEGILHLGSNILDRHPDKIEGIKVDAKCSKLHILHATCFGGGPNKPGNPLHVPDGTFIGQYMIKYADGSGEGIAIVYGDTPTTPATSDRANAAHKPASAGRRRHHRHSLSGALTGRAAIGLSSTKCRKSAAIAPAVA